MAVVSEEVQTEKNWKSVLVSNWRSYVRHQSKQSFLRIRLKKKKKGNSCILMVLWCVSLGDLVKNFCQNIFTKLKSWTIQRTLKEPFIKSILLCPVEVLSLCCSSPSSARNPEQQWLPIHSATIYHCLQTDRVRLGPLYIPTSQHKAVKGTWWEVMQTCLE